VRRPGNWTDTKKSGVINIQSHDHCLVMTLSAPALAGKAGELRTDGIKTLRSQYKNVQVQPATGSQVGGIPTTTDAITVTPSKGRQVRILLSVGTGSKYAYLTQVTYRDPACTGDLQLANLMLRSVQYTK
jgi:hypothetical protein